MQQNNEHTGALHEAGFLALVIVSMLILASLNAAFKSALVLLPCGIEQ